jgi:hypothetical protein
LDTLFSLGLHSRRRHRQDVLFQINLGPPRSEHFVGSRRRQDAEFQCERSSRLTTRLRFPARRGIHQTLRDPARPTRANGGGERRRPPRVAVTRTTPACLDGDRPGWAPRGHRRGPNPSGVAITHAGDIITTPGSVAEPHVLAHPDHPAVAYVVRLHADLGG